MNVMSTSPATSSKDGFFGSVSPLTIKTLTIGTHIEAIYDDLGARRPGRYHTITGTVELITDDATRGLRVTLSDVTRTRPSSDPTPRPGVVLDGRNIMTLTAA